MSAWCASRLNNTAPEQPPIYAVPPYASGMVEFICFGHSYETILPFPVVYLGWQTTHRGDRATLDGLPFQSCTTNLRRATHGRNPHVCMLSYSPRDTNAPRFCSLSVDLLTHMEPL